MAHRHGFKSKAQWRYCFAHEARNAARGWECRKEAHFTPSYHALPPRKGVHVRTLRKLV